MPPKTAGAKKVRRKEKKNVAHGHAHIKSTFNNTIISITDPTGAVIAWASAGQVGFKGAASPRVAAQLAAESAARRAMEHGMRKSMCSSRVPAPGDASVHCRRPVLVGSISDVAVPHNGPVPRSVAASDRVQTKEKKNYGAIHRRRLQALPPRKDEAVPQGEQV